MAKEINLVPDIKDEFIRALKFRNFVFFLCIVISASSLIVILIFLGVAGGQQGFITAKQVTIDALEKKISDYEDLSDFLTIRDQLGNIASINDNKVMMSRTFNALSAIIPRGADYVSVSQIAVNLSRENDAATFTLDAQADAGTEPYIDYKVLDSFKKSMQYMRYDYGEYVDKDGQTIPAYCMIESDKDGSTFKDKDKGYYAYWLIQGEGCNPSAGDEEESEDNDFSDFGTTPSVTSVSSDDLFGDEDDTFGLETNTLDTSNPLQTTTTTSQPTQKAEPTLDELSKKYGYKVEKYNNENVVKVWRTPQFAEWYKENSSDAHMDLSGNIQGVPHFNSACIKYSGTEKDNSIVWASTNESCLLVPNGSEGIIVESSSNGRDTSNKLVLRFTATISFAQEFFAFKNHHMLALPPTGHRNVTDSYAQIQSIFAERASDCDQSDTECVTTSTGDDSLPSYKPLSEEDDLLTPSQDTQPATTPDDFLNPTTPDVTPSSDVNNTSEDDLW